MDRLARRFVRIAGVLCLAVTVGVMPRRVGAQPTPPRGVAYAAGFVPGSRTIFDLNLAAEMVGDFPKGLKLLKGNMELVLKDGANMLKATSASEFLISLPEFLPQDFTVEFTLVPKLCCSAPDLSFEGTRTVNQDIASAHLLPGMFDDPQRFARRSAELHPARACLGPEKTGRAAQSDPAGIPGSGRPDHRGRDRRQLGLE